MGGCCETSTANENKTFFTETGQERSIDPSGNSRTMRFTPIKMPAPSLPTQPSKSNGHVTFQKKFDNVYGKLKQ